MRSRASFRGHPSHPALIPFPLAFMTGADTPCRGVKAVVRAIGRV